MQIPPSTSLLHALSRPLDPASTPAARKATGNEAARAAARAVFAQLNNVPAVNNAPVPVQARQAQPPAVQHNPAPVIPNTPPTTPMPRGSIVNILV